MSRTIVRNGLVVAPGGAAPATLIIEGERIAGLLDPSAAISGDDEIDAAGLVILPGAIDAHTHFIQDDPEIDLPNEEEFEGFANGGRGAAAGGVTTVVEMPQAARPTIDGAIFRRRVDLARQDAIVDFALWGGVCGGQRPEALDEQIAAGAAGFKAFMCDSDPMFPGVNDAQLLATLEHLKDTPYLFGLHAESDSLLQDGLNRMQESGRKDALAHHDSRPAIVEAEAVNRAIFFAEQTGGWVHIVHMSAPSAVELVRQAKARGVRVTAETCPQYLAMDHEDLARLKGFAKCAPAIRDRAQVEALWEYVLDGTIDLVTSDHCGFSAASKERGAEDIWQAPNGLPGIQTLLPVMISEGRKRGLSWERIAELTATIPAKFWHLAPKKGAIVVGADADLAFVDPAGSWTVRDEDMLHTQRWTPFAGQTLSGQVVRTMLRGRTIYQAGRGVMAEPGSGEFIPAIVG
ncbi:MAG: allantoinase AllB [Thermomicrobiales bacterium]